MRFFRRTLAVQSATTSLAVCTVTRRLREGCVSPPGRTPPPDATSSGATDPAAAPPPCSSSTSSKAAAAAVQLDDTDEWIMSFVQHSVDSGRHSQEAADYFRSIMHDESDFRQCLLEARRLIGGQDPERLTRYQQGLFADRLSNFMSGIASDKLRRAHAEEQSTKRYTEDGTPTGENYWFEAGHVLSSPAVPADVKDAILKDMQRDRSAKSPAYRQPAEEEQLAAEDDGYAAHLRRQRHKLLRDPVFK
ncbi:hypothetical protein LSCM1_06670 [Leishmania martiniquensis]|uniref:Uncharacterized protein n=1 Tax=Leishmania martiniquensis TaxID=1580590 RepID=A0A836KNL3_9TRYP|nr:hypothetical protein LSCM1_06670 [Leishmania martiniquensis]